MKETADLSFVKRFDNVLKEAKLIPIKILQEKLLKLEKQ